MPSATTLSASSICALHLGADWIEDHLLLDAAALECDVPFERLASLPQWLPARFQAAYDQQTLLAFKGMIGEVLDALLLNGDGLHSIASLMLANAILTEARVTARIVIDTDNPFADAGLEDPALALRELNDLRARLFADWDPMTMFDDLVDEPARRTADALGLTRLAVSAWFAGAPDDNMLA